MVRTPPGRQHQLSDQLAEIIASRGLSCYALGQLAGLDPSVIARFLNGQRGLTLDSVDKIAGALGLRLAEVGTRRGRRPAKPATG